MTVQKSHFCKNLFNSLCGRPVVADYPFTPLPSPRESVSPTNNGEDNEKPPSENHPVSETESSSSSSSDSTGRFAMKGNKDVRVVVRHFRIT